MAVLDVEQNAVVIRIVYDGPPEAGKTTSLRALSASLARPMITPAEVDERTLYFDWLEYTGGLFEGHQIRCQVVTVPGQTVLAHRRHALLESADVVVFVSDSTPDAVETTRAYMTEMRATLDALDGPPVGVIVQANKRDLPTAVPMDVLRAAIPGRGIAVLESVATHGDGVREAFVFAVRLALDRVRELLRNRALELGPPPVQSEAELLRLLQSRETPETLAAAAFESTVASSTADAVIEHADEDDLPLTPDPNVPAGMIWPPVEGRVLLLDACSTSFVPAQTTLGDWIGDAGEWRFHSPRQAVYADPELGRRALIEWARLHASGQRWLSAPRIVVLAPSGGMWRLWQIVKVAESLRDRVSQAVDHSPRGVLRCLLDAGRVLLSAAESLPLAPCRLPITVDLIGTANGAPQFIGYLPDPFLYRTSMPIAAQDRPTLLRRELSALAATELRGHDGRTFPSLHSVVRDNDPAAVIDALHDVLLDAGLVDREPIITSVPIES